MKDMEKRNQGNNGAGDGQEIDRESTMDGAMRILEALSGAEEELLERSGSTASDNRSRIWQRYPKAWAAVLCLAVAGVMSWGGNQLTRKVKNAMDNTSGGMSAGLEEIAAAPEDSDGFEEGAAEAGAAEQKQDDYSSQNADATDDMQNGMGDGGSDGMEAGTSADTGGEKKQSGNSASTESAGGAEEEGLRQEAAEESLDTDGCLPLNAKQYTQEEARSQELLGRYIPEGVPQGYVFENANTNLDMEEANLAVTWSRGMDFITWNVIQVKEVPETVDVEAPESYDERLYEIPHAESVPEEYRQSVDHPVFAWEDFTLEAVRSRMISYADSGDTNTPRGNFAVLYPDNILVRFNGRGTAEEIWEMFASVVAVSEMR